MHYSVVQIETEVKWVVAPASRRLSGGRLALPLSDLPRVRRFQVADQPLKGFLIRVVVLPVAEVGDEILANLAGGIFSGVGVEASPAQGFKGRQPDGEQHAPLIAHLALAGLGDFR